MDKEVWKNVVGYEGLYEVSNLGRVKSKSRLRKCGSGFYITNDNIIHGAIDSGGYFCVCLRKNSISKTISVHKLIAIAFLNNNLKGHKLEVNHINFDKLDNRLSNIELVTTRENGNKKHLKHSSIYTGVSWNKWAKKWSSQISIKRKTIHLGYFKNEFDAHLAYQNELIKLNINEN